MKNDEVFGSSHELLVRSEKVECHSSLPSVFLDVAGVIYCFADCSTLARAIRVRGFGIKTELSLEPVLDDWNMVVLCFRRCFSLHFLNAFYETLWFSRRYHVGFHVGLLSRRRL